MISHMTMSARSTPTPVPSKICRSENLAPCRFEKWGEDAVRRFYEIVTNKENARMQGGGAWDSMSKNDAVGRSMGYRQAVLDYLKDNPGWKDRRTIAANVDVPDDGLSNALNGLVTNRSLVKRIVPGGAGTSGRLGQWRIAKGADISPKAQRRTNRQRLQLALDRSVADNRASCRQDRPER
jgi:hypothetical protein